ncbi:MAG TPA: hypothetical protein VLJ58_01865 [Ramlibacter sp.]|nr:hypothetical protein [Ramlibacter sp.]
MTARPVECRLSAHHLQPMVIMALPNDEAIKQAVMAAAQVLSGR